VLVGSLLYPAARLCQSIGRHPVEEDAVGDRATEAAQPGSHGRDDDAGPSRENLAELGDGALQHVDLPAKLTGADPEPEF
jgi:hypothetical protein